MKLLLINFFHLAALATARHAMKLAESAVAATENLATKAAATSNRVDQIEQNQANMQAKTNDIEAKTTAIEEDKNKMKDEHNTLDEKQTQLENDFNNKNQDVAEELAKLKERMSCHGPVINTMEFGKDIEILFFIRSNILYKKFVF